MSDGGMRSAKSVAIILIVHLAVIVLWQVLVDAFQVPKFILPSPLATLGTLGSAKYAWLSNLAVTAAEILGGFCLGAFVGVLLAMMFTWSPLVSLVSTILSDGVRAGVFRKGINPVHLYISIAGLSYFYFSNTPTLSAIFGKDLSSPAARRARRKHVADLVMQSLRP